MPRAQELCQLARSKWELRGVAVAHRTGLVRVGEASVVIAVSSAHRREALEVRAFACVWQRGRGRRVWGGSLASG